MDFIFEAGPSCCLTVHKMDSYSRFFKATDIFVLNSVILIYNFIVSVIYILNSEIRSFHNFI